MRLLRSVVVLAVLAAPRAASAFTYSASNTNSGTQNYVTFDIGWKPAGTTIRVGTCVADDLIFANANNTDTLLVLVDDAGTILASNDDAADGWTPECGYASYLVYTTATDASLRVRGACYANVSCSGDIIWRSDYDANGALSNVPAAFAALGDGERMKPLFNQNGVFGDGYTDDFWTWNQQHLQGIQRIRNPGSLYDLIVLSGSEWADIIYLQFSPKYGNGFIGPRDVFPPADVSRGLARASFNDYGANHMGGMQVTGRYLFAGLEGDTDQSLIFNFDTEYHDAPIWIRDSIVYVHTSRRDGGEFPYFPTGQAAFVAVAKRPGQNQGAHMMVGGSGSGDVVDYYYLPPNGWGYANLRNDAWDFRGTVTVNGYWPPAGSEGFQSLNFVAQTNGLLYAVATFGRGSTNPEGGTDEIYLYQVNIDSSPPTLTYIDKIGIDCFWSGGWIVERGCAFNAAAGIFVDPPWDSLELYATKAWRPNNVQAAMNIVEFW